MAGAVPLARRLFLTGAATILCPSCGDTWVKTVPQAMRTAFSKGDDLHVTREDIERIPYASLAVRFEDYPQALLILGRADGADLHWISNEREVIVTRRGRVVKTSGLPDDLKSTRFLTDDPVGRAAGAFASDRTCARMIDIEPRHLDGIVVRSQFDNAGSETLTILDSNLSTDVWIESNRAPVLDWEFKNRFWADSRSGFVWKSVQYVSPRLPPLELVVFRRALEDQGS
jgi:hypothetical protein